MEGIETITNIPPATTEPLNQPQDEGNNYMTFFTKGNSLFESGSFPEALEEIEKAIQILVEQAQAKAMKTMTKEEEETTDLNLKRVLQQQTFFQRRIVKYSKFLYRELQSIESTGDSSTDHSVGPHYVYENLKMALNCRAKILIALGYPAMALLDSFFVLEKLEFPQSLEQGDDAVDGMINAFIAMKNYTIALQNINVQIQNYQIQSIDNEKTKQLNEKRDWILNEIKANQNDQTPYQPLASKFSVPTFKRKLDDILGNRAETDDQVVQGLLKECSPLHAHVITTEQYGRGMYASSELKCGQVVLSEKPFLCVTLDTENTCNNCLNKLKRKIPCKNNCGMEYYCSVECRGEAWDKYHRKLCGLDMTNINKMIMSGSTNSAKNHLHAIKYLGMLLQVVYPQGDLTQKEIRYAQFIEKLEENNSSVKCLIALPNILNDLIGKLTYHVSLDKIGNNSFKYGNAMSNGVSLSSTLPKTIVYTNHSCVPNVEYRYENGKCSLIALRKIKKGEQLFISYVNPSLSAQKRAESILPYVFVCGCEKCEKDGCNKILTNLMENYKKK